MSDAMMISNVLLWTALVALTGILLALVRQIGVLHERIAPAGALMDRSGPSVGETPPILELQDWNLRTRRIGGREPSGRTTLLFFVAPGCPICKSMLPVIRIFQKQYGRMLKLVFASDGSRPEFEDFVRDEALDQEVFILSSALGLHYSVPRVPYAVLLDEDGVIRAKGLVNSREHLESLFEARDLSVGSIQEYLGQGRPQALPLALETTA